MKASDLVKFIWVIIGILFSAITFDFFLTGGQHLPGSGKTDLQREQETRAAIRSNAVEYFAGDGTRWQPAAPGDRHQLGLRPDGVVVWRSIK